MKMADQVEVAIETTEETRRCTPRHSLILAIRTDDGEIAVTFEVSFFGDAERKSLTMQMTWLTS